MVPGKSVVSGTPADTITKEDIVNFEKEIAEIFATGAIRAPVHLRAGREDQLIKIFRDHKIGAEDYVFGYWDSHELALLKGVPREAVKQAILDGRSISLCFPEHHVYCSGIAGSLMGTATGVAWALKQQGKKGRAFIFCGDMSAETGSFHEAVKYAYNFDLPAMFIVCDNGVSVMTDTRATWGNADPWFKGTRYEKNIIYFQYVNGYPHSGLGKLIKF
jgi:TPP-dependent pyruvate/acetoin dehydrogenase alpha subunit